MAEFADAVKAWASKSEKNMVLVRRKIAMEVLRRVVLRSPVGNIRLWKVPRKGYVGGRFRGNWQVGIGSAPSLELSRIDPSGSLSIADGTSKIMGAELAGDEKIVIVNNLPYGEALEKGHSKQAPVGMVAITVAEFGGIVEEATR